MKKFPHYRQFDKMDCGPTCIRMVAKHFGRSYSLQRLRELSGINRLGVSLLGISEAAEKIGFRTMGARLRLQQLTEIELPCILHWNQRHFVVLYKISKKDSKEPIYHIADPADKLSAYKEQLFSKHWLNSGSNGSSNGVLFTLSPSPAFYEQEGEKRNRLDLS